MKYRKNNIKISLLKLDEPSLSFGYDQTTFDPRDGLTIFGPASRLKIDNIDLGIIGTNDGIKRVTTWLKRIQKPVWSLENDPARPYFPGFETVFEASINFDALKTIEIEPEKISHFLKHTDSHVRIYNLAGLYVDELIRYKKEEEDAPKVWIVVIPDDIYTFGRPKSSIPSDPENIKTGIKDRSQRVLPQLFPIDQELQKSYKFEKHFHNQLKARLLKDQIVTQVIRESTIAYRDFRNKANRPKRDLAKFESAIAWNISNALYYKSGGVPWKLGAVREGVCYVGLVYKRVDTERDEKTACCAAQMFLDSGDGLVFRGNIGPWYNPDNYEYHLSYKSAKELLTNALSSFKRRNQTLPKEIFIHAKTYFDDNEWSGFVDACTKNTKLVGIRIRDDRVFKLFRDHSYPILRGMMLKVDEKSAFLWTRGFIARIETQLGLETPNPLEIEICRGDSDLKTVCQDILALTKLNYNSCIFADGKPVTLRFADMIGSVLTAGPKELTQQVLPFKHYI
jgi:hypothetical protein